MYSIFGMFGRNLPKDIRNTFDGPAIIGGMRKSHISLDNTGRDADGNHECAQAFQRI
jgi:hypothetical protein